MRGDSAHRAATITATTKRLCDALVETRQISFCCQGQFMDFHF
jgi:hypothetical protein